MIRLIATGGTFDKHYDAVRGQLVFASGHLAAAVQRARITLPLVVEELPLMDSLDMQPVDRQRIVDACGAASEQAIVIVHGTDTMVDTARLIGEMALSKTIVLTGAMIPYEIANSDALFNLGFACGVAQTLRAGVYVAMNSQYFRWDNVRKNREAGMFEAIR
jgi:L-asparaginase